MPPALRSIINIAKRSKTGVKENPVISAIFNRVAKTLKYEAPECSWKQRKWVWEHIYIDVGESAFVPPSVFLPVGEEAGIVIVPSRGEVYIYGGGGAGAGGGASATLNLGNPPTEGWSSKLTGTLGGGLGIKYTQSEKGQSVGVGIGIEASVKGTKTYYKKIIDINLRKKKKGDK